MEHEQANKSPELRRLVIEIVIGSVLGLVFLFAGWFGRGDVPSAMLFLLSVGASGAAVLFAAQTKSTRWAAFFAGALAAVALVSAGMTFVSSQQDDTRIATATSPLTVAFDQPANDAAIPLAGTAASGSLSGAKGAGQSLWLAFSSPDDGGVHYVTKRVEATASTWSVSTVQVGTEDPAEVGKRFVLEVVLAGSVADQAFETAVADPKLTGWPELPPGASIVATRSVVRAQDPLHVQMKTTESIDGLPGISSKVGFMARGTVRGLNPGESLWLMDKDGVGYTIAQEATIAGSNWSASSIKLVEEGTPLPFKMDVSVIKADQQCANTLRAETNAGNWSLPGLPVGCLEMDAKPVEVTRP